ncbi:MAG: outer membrane lipoprotein-sorting protein [Sphaerochaetaceae bacterium]|nr:outer membrane lipoprotein-sorting protein [Sphaerochaetaceae bacterium]
MIKKHRLKMVAAVIYVVLAVTQTISAMTAAQIMEKVENTQKHDSSALDISLELIGENGEVRTRRIQTLNRSSEQNNESITIFLSPASVRQTRFLSIEKENYKEQWIYLPALKQSRKIGSAERGASFMGSDFSYEDMDSTTFDSDEAAHTVIGETGEIYIIESVPYESDAVYGRTITYVDKESFLPSKVQLFDEKGTTMIKELIILEKDLIDGSWVATKMEMRTISTGHRSVITIVQAKYDIPIPSSYFSLQFLKTGRI